MEIDSTTLAARRGAGLPLTDPLAAPPIHSPRVGTLVGIDAQAGVTVTYAGQPGEAPLPARSTVALAPCDAGREVVLLFEDGDPARPLVTGLLLPQPVAATAEGTLPRDGAPGITADGRDILVEAERELVLRCGKSSIVLRADGEVYIRGMKIVSRARGTNKIRGATVQIN